MKIFNKLKDKTKIKLSYNEYKNLIDENKQLKIENKKLNNLISFYSNSISNSIKFEDNEVGE